MLSSSSRRALFSRLSSVTMSQSQPLSYSAVLGKAADHGEEKAAPAHEHKQPNASAKPVSRSTQASTTPSQNEQDPSSYQRPKTGSANEARYVLTLRTDRAHHDRMSAMRDKYFPPERNTVRAHLTLFNALPESKMKSSIVPLLQEVAAATGPFRIRVKRPFQMKEGFGVNMSPREGPPPLKDLLVKLRGTWKEEGFLSDQDSAPRGMHYTLMNKVSDKEKLEAAFEEFKESWTGDEGIVDGLELFRYHKGRWYWTQSFEFTGQPYLDKRLHD
jgi:2'-5' RNA ligase